MPASKLSMRFRALGCSACVHAAAAGIFLRAPWLALVLLVTGGILVQDRAGDLFAVPDWRLAARRAGYAAAFFACCILLYQFILWEMRRMTGIGGFGGTRVLANQLADPHTAGEQGSGAGDEFDNAHPGVVIYSGQEQKILMTPPPRALREGLSSAHKPRPYEIPFFGAYWLYRPPQKRPPLNSQITHGQPSEMRFRSTDRIPLKMEARQNLGRLVDLRCCKAVEVRIVNADPYPTSVLIELVLNNTSLPGEPSLSLGAREVHSSKAGFAWRPVVPTSETLSFPIPASRDIQAFDELRVIFHLSPFREERSARISIDRFVLIPRGL